MKKYMKLMMALFVMVLLLAACGGNNDNEGKNDTNNNGQNNEGDGSGVPVVTMTMENGGEMKMELYPDIAPTSVNNFISLVEDGYYDGLTFHRVIPGFMIQGGDPDGDGTGGPGYYIKGEFAANGFDNDLKHERGVLSMARSMHPDSAGSQFFIMVEDAPHLDGEYAGFGKVIEGIKVADEIVSVDRDLDGDKPLEDQVIEKMTVELNGYKPGEIEKADI